MIDIVNTLENSRK